jgi:hypothetical protein
MGGEAAGEAEQKMQGEVAASEMPGRMVNVCAESGLRKRAGEGGREGGRAREGWVGYGG